MDGKHEAALFLDFDGTLVEIAPRPEDVVVDPGLPGLLDALRARLGGALAIVTGRPVAAVDLFLPGVALDACGLHGLERRSGGRLLEPEGLPDLSAEARLLGERLAGHPGIVIENKGISVAVHWRTAPEAEADARAAIGEMAARLGASHRIQDGKAVAEIVPQSAGKGGGIAALMRLPPYAGRRPVFVGDDLTDEDGFRAVAALGGLTIKIGAGETVAAYRISTPAAFRGTMVRWRDGGVDEGDLEAA